MARHRRVRAHRFEGFRHLAAALGLIASPIIVALALTGGTYALWNHSVAIAPHSTLTAGSASIAVTSALSMPTTLLYPGLTIYGSETVSNTGTVALGMRATLVAPAAPSPYSDALIVALATASSAANCSLGIVTSAWSSGTFTAPTIAAFGSPLASGSAGNIVCVSLTLAGYALAGAQSGSLPSLAITITGFQS